MINNLLTCPKCEAPESCYTTELNEFHKSYVCFNCGFQTNDLMRVGEFNFDEYEESLPELYKELKYTDSENRVWYPHVINIEDKGTVFANGTSKEDWHWSAIKSKKLTKEEKSNPRFKDKKYKSDSSTLKNFGDDYFEACDYIGFFDIPKDLK